MLGNINLEKSGKSVFFKNLKEIEILAKNYYPSLF
jgi:hypothetical protein